MIPVNYQVGNKEIHNKTKEIEYAASSHRLKNNTGKTEIFKKEEQMIQSQ